MKAERSRRFGKYQAEVRCGSARRRCLMGGSYEHERRKSRIARWRLFILHGGTEKFFGTLISFFRSFISFFRTFISALGEEFSFSRELAGISSVGSVIRSRESVFLIGRGRIYIIVVWRGFCQWMVLCARLIGSFDGSCRRSDAYPQGDKRGRVAVSRGVSQSAPRQGSQR